MALKEVGCEDVDWIELGTPPVDMEASGFIIVEEFII
jgi:hypothetical protein